MARKSKDGESHDFNDATRKLICDRAAARCANPNCRRIARFPSASNHIVNFGDAAHIIAAGDNGPRKRPASAKEVSSESNGLWLCAACHRIVDRDPSGYSEERLRLWKRISETEFAYDPVTPAISLPGHYKDDALDKTPGLPGTTASLGLHVLIGPSKDLRAVCTKVTVEVLSAFGYGEFRAYKYYRNVGADKAETGADWHSFMFTDGMSENIYFVNRQMPWLAHNPAERPESILLLRAKAYGRLGSDDLEPFVSPWVVGIVNLNRLEYDDQNSFSHLLKSADLLVRLFKSGSTGHSDLAKRVIQLQQFRNHHGQLLVESINNGFIEQRPSLMGIIGTNMYGPREPLNLGLEVIDGAYGDHGYMLKHSFALDPAKAAVIDQTNIHEFWNGQVEEYIQRQDEWRRLWVRGGTVRAKLISNGGLPPRYYNHHAI